MRNRATQKEVIRTKEVYYPSALSGTKIHTIIWIPNQRPLAHVQISHGMAEYARRYDDFARFLASRGFVVCANDHIGHGESSDPDHWGILPENADEIMLADMRTLQETMQQAYDGIPYFLLGHSMGSFLARAYISRYGSDLDGAIIMGTAQLPVSISKLGNMIAHLVGRMRGMDYRSKFLDGMGAGGYGKKIKDAKTDLDWLNTDPKAVDQYAKDPACGFMFSAGGYCAITNLTRIIAEPQTVQTTPDDFPVLFASGAEDPVGNFGDGPTKAAEQMRTLSSAKVTVKIYDGMRHEILNEPGHAEVYADIERFLTACLHQETK